MKVKKDHSVAFAWFGLIAIAAFIIAWMGAAALDPAWEFGVDELSDLGVSETDAQYYFNYGCIITGALIALFGIGNALYHRNYGETVGGCFLVLGGIFMALIGIFTSDSPDMHKFVTIVMFTFLLCAVISNIASDWHENRMIFAGLSIVLIFVAIGLYLFYEFAAFEAWGVILLMIWCGIQVAKRIAGKPSANISDIQ